MGQRASILQCLDSPIENALGLVKIAVRPPITLSSDRGVRCTLHIHGLTSMSHLVNSFCMVCYKT